MSATLVINVRRNEPELVCPARPTPNELKPLSDIDNIPPLRINVSSLLSYPANEDRKDGKDPVKVIKAALAEALVYYYPWAGRLREGTGGKLAVDCTAEGVVFVEADADARLDQFGGESPLLPFPCVDQFLYSEASSDPFRVVDCPMFTLQVTRLLCGGFIMGINFNHVMSDSVGVVQFLNAVAELARGASSPSILPVWRRELLNARVTNTSMPVPDDQHQDKQFYVPELLSAEADLVCRTFIFTDQEVTALRACVPQYLQPCTSFELICACIWRCRIIALQYPLDEVVHMGFAVNFRDKFNPPLPVGYYGNACAPGTCVSPAGAICSSSLGYVVELVKKAKAAITEEYTRSILDHLVLGGQRIIPMPNTYNMSDVSSSVNSFPMLDFGWGKPFYAGPPTNGFLSHSCGFILAYRNGKGKAVSVSLPKDAMERFVNAFQSLLKMDLSH